MSHSRMAGQRDSASEQGDIEPLLSGYCPPPGTFDEMVDREGRVRAHWQPLLAMLARLGPNELRAGASPPPIGTCAIPGSSIASTRMHPGPNGPGR
jgi:hypothetical protein